MIKVEITLSELQALDACPEGLALFKKVYGDKAEIIWDEETQKCFCVSEFKNDIIWAQNKNIIPKYSLSYANLVNANLVNANLVNANLEDAYLESANLRFANLKSANLFNANLKSANLFNANLFNANFKFANLSNANLKFANLVNTNLVNANLEGANLEYVKYNKYTIFPENFSLPATAILVE